MKANAPKRKVFQDALDLLAEDPVKDTPVAVNGIVSIPVEEIHPFHDHPFRLYEGERLEDMVQSIREHGVLNPVIVRKAARGYEMLAGHNRTNAAKIKSLVIGYAISDYKKHNYLNHQGVRRKDAEPMNL